MVVYKVGNTVLWQVLFTDPACKMYMRSYSFNSSTWSSWSRIDNYGTSTAAQLATLLGVGNIAVPTGATSFDSFTTPGYTVIGTTVLAGITNKHSDMLFGMICVRVFTSNLIQQIYYNIRGNKDIFVRYRDSDNVWQTTWRKIATTA